MPIKIDKGKDIEEIKNSFIIDDEPCSHPAGHCYGSDGGSGIPENLKVATGRGGSEVVWELNNDKSQVLGKYNYLRCQYCMKYRYQDEVT